MLDYISHPSTRGQKDGCNPRRCVAYVTDPSAVDGAAVLFDQKRTIDGYAAVRGLQVLGYVVDSGSRSSGAGIARGLRGLLWAVRREDVDLVVVEHISRFATDFALALRIAAALSVAGAAVHEARGDPTIIPRVLAARLATDAFQGLGGVGAPVGERSLAARRSR